MGGKYTWEGDETNEGKSKIKTKATDREIWCTRIKTGQGKRSKTEKAEG